MVERILLWARSLILAHMETSISPPELVSSLTSSSTDLKFRIIFIKNVGGVIFKTGENEKQDNQVWI